jgi:glycerophosphoryl diester phosphodiesterase
MNTMKKTIIFESALVFTLLFSLFPQPFKVESTGELGEVEIVAHRGASGYAPENTIAAFDKAVEMNADYIEIDVQRSQDGKLVVIHDQTVDRTTNGTGNVKDLTFQQLNQLDAGSWKGIQFTGEKIPTFEEILDRYHEKIGILIELKSPELYPGLEEQVVQIFEERNLDQLRNGTIIIQSFNHDSMKKMNQLLPKIPIGVLTSNKEHTTEQALKDFSSYADYFNPNYKLLTEELVHQAYSQGMKVFPWTVRSNEAAEFVLDMNIAAIITDYPKYVDLSNESSILSLMK